MKLDTLKNHWVECHYNIVRLIRQGRGTLENPTYDYVMEKRRKIRLECMIEMKEKGIVSKGCQEECMFWMNVEPKDDPC